MSILSLARWQKKIQFNQFTIRPGNWVLFFALVGFGLRLHRLNFQPLWGDEGWSFYLASQPVSQLLALTARDIHPPLYYLLLKLWLLVLGSGAEEARLLSVGAGVLLIPAVGLAGQRLFGRQTGLAGAAITALMPLAVYYSQEVRMYGLVTLLGALSICFLLRIEGQPAPGRQTRAAYVGVTAAALYTHYYAAFLVLAQVIYILLTHLRRRPLTAVFTRLMPIIYAGALYLPWAVYVGSQLVAYVENKRNVEGYAPLNPIEFLGDHLTAFSLGHLPGYHWAALVMVAVALPGFFWTLYRQRNRASLLYLYFGVPLVSGYLINLIYPFTPRYFERTLLLAAPAYWLLLGAGLVWLWRQHRVLVGAVAAAIALIVAVSLSHFYATPRYPHQDYRPLLAEIAARATPDDTLLASYQWQLGFYLAYLPPPRPKLFAVPGWGEGWSAQAGNAPRLFADLTAIFAGSPRLWFPAYQAGGHIWEDEAEAAIAQLGYPAVLRWYSPQTKLTLAGAGQTPTQQIPPANFENRLALLQATIGGNTYQAGRDIIPVELVWQKTNSLGSEHRVNLRLVDAQGRTWATRDSRPRAGQNLFTAMHIGDTLTDRHGLLAPAGAPPGSYRLLLSVRRESDAHPLDVLNPAGQPLGADLPLADIMLTRPVPPLGPAALPIQVYTRANFGGQVRLIGYSLEQGPFKAGENLPLTLFWESLAVAPGPLTALVELKDSSGQSVMAHQQPPGWSPTEWHQGDMLRDPQDILLPPALPPGRYQLTLTLLAGQEQPLAVNGGHTLPLTGITTIDRPRNFDAPSPQLELAVNFGGQAKLVGLDLPQTRLAAGESLPLTLYWQATGPFDKNWTVFVHLTDEAGQIISQQDQIPGGGQFPTTGWLPNEFLVDSYRLSIPANAPAGQSYRLKIGLYDANNLGSRLPVLEAGQIVGDHFTVDSWPIFVE